MELDVFVYTWPKSIGPHTCLQDRTLIVPPLGVNSPVDLRVVSNRSSCQDGFKYASETVSGANTQDWCFQREDQEGFVWSSSQLSEEDACDANCNLWQLMCKNTDHISQAELQEVQEHGDWLSNRSILLILPVKRERFQYVSIVETTKLIRNHLKHLFILISSPLCVASHFY